MIDMMKNSNLFAERLTKARKRLLKMHFESGVGHIGGNLSAIDAMMVVFHDFLTPLDTFILSKGHSAGALYIVLWSIGCVKEEDLKLFHKDGTLLGGHPPVNGFTKIPFATGSLGHGLSLAAGTALALRFKKSDGRVICMTSDGEWQEGSTWEALIFASHHQLKNLIILVDHNGLQGFGSTGQIASMNPLWDRLSGFDIDLVTVDGHSFEEISTALNKTGDKLKIIFLKTIKGHGVTFMENKMEWHYLPLTEQQYIEADEEIGSAPK